jgi:hypothetical protein
VFLSTRELADPTASLGFEFDRAQQFVDGRTAFVKRPEKAQRLFHRQLFGKLRLLKLNAEPLPQLAGVTGPRQAEHFHFAGISRKQALENFDGGGLAGPVRAEQSEAFTPMNNEGQAINRDYLAIALDEAFATDRR